MDTVLYTDGRSVKVTTQQFIVGQAHYLVDGILNARINLIRANVAGAVVMLLIGLIAAAAGYLKYFSEAQINDWVIGNITVTTNVLAIIAGAFLFLIGLVWMIASHNRYAVHITTAEGEKEPLVSTKKDYVTAIVKALNKAIH